MVATPITGRAGKYRPDPSVAFDPQDYRLGPVAVFGCQIGVVLAFVWGMGALADLFLPPTLGLLPLMAMFPVLVLTPRTTLLQFPVSLSVLILMMITFGSITWSVNPEATNVLLRSIGAPTLALIIAAGLLSEREMMTALLWAIRITIILTIIALIVSPAARTHVSTDPYLPDYPGWHGWFTHKNELSPVLGFAIPTVLVYDRSLVSKWLTMTVMAVLLVGSTSATGITSALFAVIVWFWLRVYSGQSDNRNRTLYLGATVLAGLSVIVAVAASVATITSAYGKDTTFSGRTEIWQASITAISHRPFLGYGFGALFWREPVGPETAAIWRQVGFQANHAHNGPLDMALHVGLIGVAAFAVMWVTTFVAASRALRTQRDLAVWTLAFLASNLLMAFSENVFFGTWVSLFVIAKMLLMRRPEFIELPERRWLSERLRR